ncbi:DUF1127 domain-containing protein [Halomonas sp. LS-001]
MAVPSVYSPFLSEGVLLRREALPAAAFTLPPPLCQLCHYLQRRHSCRQLLSLDDRLLEDIGITRAQAKKEAHRGFWQHSQTKDK